MLVIRFLLLELFFEIQVLLLELCSWLVLPDLNLVWVKCQVTALIPVVGLIKALQVRHISKAVSEILTPWNHGKITQDVECASILVVSVDVAKRFLKLNLIMIHACLRVNESKVVLIMRNMIIELMLPVHGDVTWESGMAVAAQDIVTLH